MAIVCLYIRPRVLEQEWHCREAYEEATFTFILLVEDVLKSYRWNEFLLVATSIHSVLCGSPSSSKVSVFFARRACVCVCRGAQLSSDPYGTNARRMLQGIFSIILLIHR